MEKFEAMVTAVVMMKVTVEAKNHEDAKKRTNRGEYKVEKIIDTHSLEIQDISKPFVQKI